MTEPVFISENPESFGVAIKRLREAQGWTRADFLRQLGKTGYYMHATTLKRIEEGEQIAKVHEAVIISRLFGVTVEEMGPAGMDEEKQLLAYLKHSNTLFADIGARFTEIVSSWLQERQTLQQHVERANELGLAESNEDLSTAHQLLLKFGTFEAIQKDVLNKLKEKENR